MKDATNPYTTIAALRDEVTDLRWYVHELEEAFFGPLPLLWHVRLTKSQSRLLAALYRHKGIVSRRGLHVATGSLNSETQEKVIDVQISHLRKKIAPMGIDIETVRTVGYRLTTASRERIRTLIGTEVRQIDERGNLFELRSAG